MEEPATGELARLDFAVVAAILEQANGQAGDSGSAAEVITERFAGEVFGAAGAEDEGGPP